jgi:hypothetical protein
MIVKNIARAVGGIAMLATYALCAVRGFNLESFMWVFGVVALLSALNTIIEYLFTHEITYEVPIHRFAIGSYFTHLFIASVSYGMGWMIGRYN